ncbi:dispanin subfamily A member 2b-like [Protopterus annectens]|uniref:dispanin subfamily A member 2b-like n=1 Tax=Protopterus annectens TaxID=7888 RepID=UPI001CFB675A|nr:dispanin subfamily A member 2b-like [Protopterus annectens]
MEMTVYKNSPEKTFDALPGYKAMTGSTSTVITIDPSQTPVKDHLIWSIFSVVYLNACCLGLLALYNSVKSRDQVIIGNTEKAHFFATRAKRFNIAAVIVFLILFVTLIILQATGHLHE